MCGIFGAIGLRHAFSAEKYRLFTGLTDMVAYRGPDGKGYLAFDTKSGKADPENFNVFFGHRRLAIIDLSASGAQPMKIGSCYITFNGEIYNYIELREELKSAGHTFETATDTEVIIKIYLQYGPEGFAKLNGMWAFAILDTEKQQVILSRDRFSKKPLFFYRDKDAFYFASEIKQLLPLIPEKKVNRQVLMTYLKQGVIDHTNETFFEDIFRLEGKANYIIDIASGSVTTEPYWNINEEIKIEQADVYEQFRWLLEDSVKIRLRSDVPVGCMLSGGLDSSSITALAYAHQKKEMQTFSVVSHDKKQSEEPFIDHMVSAFALKNKKLLFEPGHVLGYLDEVLTHQDEPFFNLSVLAGYSILKEIKEESDITVLLNGQGGDELLMGYLKYFFFYEKDLIRKGKYLQASSLLLSALFNRTILNQFNIGKAKRYMPSYMSRKESYLVEEGSPVDTWSFDSLRHRQELDIDRFSIPVLCRYEDRNSMAHSLEMRVPFLDYRLVSFCLSLRNDLKINNGWTKYILRKSMRELPEAIKYRRDKKGFSIPEEQFLRNELKPEILRVMQDSLLDKMGFIRKDEFLTYYQNFLEKKGAFSEFTDITRVFIAEMWLRKYFQN